MQFVLYLVMLLWCCLLIFLWLKKMSALLLPYIVLYKDIWVQFLQIILHRPVFRAANRTLHTQTISLFQFDLYRYDTSTVQYGSVSDRGSSHGFFYTANSVSLCRLCRIYAYDVIFPLFNTSRYSTVVFQVLKRNN